MTTCRFVISAIVPTVGRPESLGRLLESLAAQSRRPDEVIVADASGRAEVAAAVAAPRWRPLGLDVTLVTVPVPNAVGQREAAITTARGDALLLLDDDVMLEAGCVEELEHRLSEDEVVAAMADYSNQPWPQPTRAWRIYLRLVHGMRPHDWNGRVVGPLLRFGYEPSPQAPADMDWIATGHTLIRRDAFVRAGGFARFFLRRATTHEDVDLGVRLRRVGRILLCPAARFIHLHDPAGRLSIADAAEDDVFNRFQVLRHTLRLSAVRALGLTAVYVVLESAGQLAGGFWRGRGTGAWPRLAGRARGLTRAIGAAAGTGAAA